MNNKKIKLISFILIFALILLTVYIVFVLNNKDNKPDKEDPYSNLNIQSNTKAFDIKLDSAMLIIEEGNKFTISTNNKYISLTEEDNKIKINEKDHFSFKNSSALRITVPKNYNFTDLNIVSDGGFINIENLKADRLSLQLKAGSLVLNDVIVNDKLTIIGGAGTIDVTNGNVNNLNLNVGVGNCNISAILKGNSVIEAGVGQLNIDLLDSIDNYKIKLAKGIGDITINDTKITDNNTAFNGNKNIKYNGKIYKPTKVIDNKNVIFNTNSNFRFTPEFQKELLTDANERDGENYSKYFVFPALESKDTNSDLKNFTVTSDSKFKELLSIKSKISIEGSSRTGKSILAKYLTNQLSEDYTVLFLTEDSFTPKNIKNIIKYAIQNEFGDNADVDEFLQLEKEKKILIVDGNDKVNKEKWRAFLDEYSEQFGHIITFCGIDWNMNIKDRTVEELTENAFFYLKICPFYYVKREQLIKKICSNYLVEYPSLDVEEKSRKINEDITNQIKYFQLTPDFIHQFVDY